MLTLDERAATTPDDRVADRVVHAVWGGLLTVLTGGPVLYALAARRPFRSDPSPLFGTVSPAFTDGIRALVAVLVVGAVVAMAILALPVARTPKRGALAVAAAVTFGGAGILSGLVNGSTVGIGHLALPLTALAMGMFPPPSREWFERRFTLALRVLVWGSLVAAAVVPGWAVQLGYDSSVLGLATRLAGLTPHPNALGPIAVVLVVLEWRRQPRVQLAVLAAAGALLWTQSKTSWAALGVFAAVVLARRLRRRSPEKTMLPVLVLAMVVGSSAWFGLGLAADGQDTVRQDESAETFTGRTSIWEVTLEVWRDEPLLGSGTGLWDDAMDRRYRHRVGFPPGHAHNQLIHTLGESGLVGASALVGLLVALGGLARRADRSTAGVAGALFLVLVVQCFSEVPMQSIPNGSNFLLLFGTFGYLLLAAREVERG